MSRVNHILVPTDFSESADKALAYALDLASLWNAQVHLLHAFAIPAFPDGLGIGVDVITPLSRAAEEAMERKLQKHPSLTAAASVRMGDPRDIIVDAAKEIPADLIVMGSHGRRGMKRVLLGSVAEEVLRTAPCPVLIVPQATVA